MTEGRPQLASPSVSRKAGDGRIRFTGHWPAPTLEGRYAFACKGKMQKEAVREGGGPWRFVRRTCP